jgi:hypothetical protein
MVTVSVLSGTMCLREQARLGGYGERALEEPLGKQVAVYTPGTSPQARAECRGFLFSLTLPKISY